MWIPSAKLTGYPKRCSKCKTMRWNSGASGRAPKVAKLGSENNLAETLEKAKAFESTLPQITVQERAVGSEKVGAVESEEGYDAEIEKWAEEANGDEV